MMQGLLLPGVTIPLYVTWHYISIDTFVVYASKTLHLIIFFEEVREWSVISRYG